MSDFPISIRGRFKRSVDLVRDFHSAPNIEGYIVTPTARKVLGQISESLREERPERAWTLTGPYGGGKSAFALFASYVMGGLPAAISHLKEADAELAAQFKQLQSSPLCPVLIGGSRQSLNKALLEGLSDSVQQFIEGEIDLEKEDVESLRKVVEKAQRITEDDITDDKEVVDLFISAAEAVHHGTGGGLFIVVDELGKMLEYAALDPERGDIFVLQQLAEHASRTAGGGQAPIFLSTILHQAFDRYASHLDRVQREEWQKVQGRFEDVAYVEPVDTTLQLLAEAIQVRDEKAVEQYSSQVKHVVDAANLPNRFDAAETKSLLSAALPLHPTVSLMVGPLFRRLAQNERSLFAFLASGEPGGFLDVVGEIQEGDEDASVPIYRLDHLYDYLLTTLGATLFSQGTSKLWAETEAALGRVREPSELTEQLLKQIALLNFAGEMAGLSATSDLLKASAVATEEKVEEELSRLVQERVVVYRKYNDSYNIWQGSDVDIDGEVEKARSNVSPDIPLADLLRDVLPPAPIAAHRHSYEKGTIRVFEVAYASGDAWKERLESTREEADGHVLYVLPERESERQKLIDALKAEVNGQMTFVAVPDGVGALRDSVYELKCLEWVRKNVDPIEGDAAARRELRERRSDIEHRVESCLSRLLVADKSGRNPCHWIHRGEGFRIEGRRELQDRLSNACDETFTKTPEIWNELLNLRQPSPSAVRGQKLLLQAMMGDEEELGPEKKHLGIQGAPAEYGLYASILRATGMHREADDGSWYFCAPDAEEKPGCHEVWKAIEDHFESANGKRVSLDTFYDLLASPPYGLRQGLTPVFLFAYFKANEDEIAVYENGTFLQGVGFGEIERLLKKPSNFEMQQVKISGAREDLLRQLAPFVGLPEEERKPLPFVLRLLQRVRGLPPFVRKTSRMSEEAMAVREALYRASDPTEVLFKELPAACNVGIDLFRDVADLGQDRVRMFVLQLQKALREISGAYDALIEDVQLRVAAAFELRGQDSNEQRHELAERAQELESHVTDADLKAFVIRATNEVLDTQAWYESIASLLGKRPPVKWRDEDLDTFKTELRQVARKFRTREPLIFEKKERADGATEVPERTAMRLHRIRLGITMLGEPEQETVVNIHPEDENFVDTMADRLLDVIESDEEVQGKSADVKLAALSRLMQKLVNERETSLDAELDRE